MNTMLVCSCYIQTNVDQFALNLGFKVKNLSAMDADWLYSAYNHSHPILVERLRALGYKGGEDIFKKGKAEINGKVE